MAGQKIAVGMQIGTQPPLGATRALALFARLMRLESVMAIDHFQNLFPTAIWGKTIEEAIAAVPPGLVDEGPLLWGTPEQIADKLKAFGEAGMRQVVLAPVSGLVSRRAALYGMRATRRTSRLLADGR